MTVATAKRAESVDQPRACDQPINSSEFHIGERAPGVVRREGPALFICSGTICITMQYIGGYTCPLKHFSLFRENESPKYTRKPSGMPIISTKRIKQPMSTKPTDRFNGSDQKTENTRPAGGEIRPTNLKPVPERPAPKADDFGGFKCN